MKKILLAAIVNFAVVILVSQSLKGLVGEWLRGAWSGSIATGATIIVIMIYERHKK